MRSKQHKGHGRLVPMQATGVAYRVRYGIPVAGDPAQQGSGRHSMQWTKCYVRFPNGGLIPDGGYFLYSDEGKVHQLKSINGKWHCLALAA